MIPEISNVNWLQVMYMYIYVYIYTYDHITIQYQCLTFLHSQDVDPEPNEPFKPLQTWTRCRSKFTTAPAGAGAWRHFSWSNRQIFFECPAPKIFLFVFLFLMKKQCVSSQSPILGWLIFFCPLQSVDGKGFDIESHCLTRTFRDHLKH